MNINTGAPARGENFYFRKNIIAKAWELINAGNHILIAAPRRVGKTSVMYYLQDNPQNNHEFLFLDTESINNENEFFRRLVNKILQTNTISSSKKIAAFFQKHFPSIAKIGKDGIEFGVKDDRDYFEMLSNILKSVEKEQGKLIIMLDEFPQTLENIINDEGENAGRHFLHTNRELRQDGEVSRHVQFIYTGSIGLENIVGKLNATKTINDLSRLAIPPLTPIEAKDLTKQLLKTVSFDLSDSLADYLFEKIQWLIPFYIQLALEGVKDLNRDEQLKIIKKTDIDRVFKNMLDQRNHFDHWHSRLRTTMKGADYNFSKQVLNIISLNDTIGSADIYNTAVKFKVEGTFKDLLGSLVYDGYINNNDDTGTYHFNSPILKMWWRQNVAG